MRRWILLMFLGVVLVSSASADHSVFARVTVYWRGENQVRAYWKGIPLREGHCAVDPKKIPYGSKVSFADYTCVAVDTGPAVVSRKAARKSGRSASEKNAIVIDRFFESKAQAMAWAKSHPHFMLARIETPDRQSKDNTARLAANDHDDGTLTPNRSNAQTITSANALPLLYYAALGAELKGIRNFVAAADTN